MYGNVGNAPRESLVHRPYIDPRNPYRPAKFSYIAPISARRNPRKSPLYRTDAPTERRTNERTKRWTQSWMKGRTVAWMRTQRKIFGLVPLDQHRIFINRKLSVEGRSKRRPMYGNVGNVPRESLAYLPPHTVQF